jgi:hypothetical protein
MNVDGAGSAAGAQAAQGKVDVSLAVLQKSNNAQKQQGEAAIDLLENAKETASQQVADGNGLDVRV